MFASVFLSETNTHLTYLQWLKYQYFLRKTSGRQQMLRLDLLEKRGAGETIYTFSFQCSPDYTILTVDNEPTNNLFYINGEFCF